MRQDANPTSAAAPAIARVQLDAYPRLCGLPVTIERLVPGTSMPAPAQRAAPARPARARPVGRTVVVLVVLVVVAATVLAVASEARAQPPVPSLQAAIS